MFQQWELTAQPWPFSPWAHEVKCGARCCPPGRAGWSEHRKGPFGKRCSDTAETHSPAAKLTIPVNHFANKRGHQSQSVVCVCVSAVTERNKSSR